MTGGAEAVEVDRDRVAESSVVWITVRILIREDSMRPHLFCVDGFGTSPGDGWTGFGRVLF